jgi:PAS domain S-box-containing protein
VGAADELHGFELRGVLEQLAGAVVLVAPDGRVLFANERARALLGSELIGRHLSELPRRLLDEAGRALRPEEWPLPRALAAGESVVVPAVEVERPDGTVRAASVSATPLRDREGRLLGAVALFDDVTERRAAQERERLLAAAVASSQDAIIAKTLGGEIRSWNRGAEEMYGYRAVEVIGRSITLLAPPEREDEIPALLERLARGERVDASRPSASPRTGVACACS